MVIASVLFISFVVQVQFGAGIEGRAEGARIPIGSVPDGNTGTEKAPQKTRRRNRATQSRNPQAQGKQATAAADQRIDDPSDRILRL